MKRIGRTATALLGIAALCASVAIAVAADDELIVFDWAGYEEPSFHPAYTAKHGDSPSFAFFGDEDEAFEKIRSGFKADLGHPCSQSVAKWREAGLLQPLDTSKITGWNDLNPDIMAMKNLATTADGKAWFIPWDWGNTSLTYNTETVDPKDVQSLKAFADPKFKGRVSIGDNVDDAYALASLVIGLNDWTKMTDEQFKEASDFLRAVHKNVRLYWSDVTEIVQAMGGGEVDLAWAWNDAAAQLKLNGTSVARAPNADQGISTWVCGYVRFKDAPGSEAKAYDYLNAINDPAIATYMVNDWGLGVANAKGMASVDTELLDEKGYGKNQQSTKNVLFQSPLPIELKAKMIAEFEKIKAGY